MALGAQRLHLLTYGYQPVLRNHVIIAPLYHAISKQIKTDPHCLAPYFNSPSNYTLLLTLKQLQLLQTFKILPNI